MTHICFEVNVVFEWSFYSKQSSILWARILLQSRHRLYSYCDIWMGLLWRYSSSMKFSWISFSISPTSKSNGFGNWGMVKWIHISGVLQWYCILAFFVGMFTLIDGYYHGWKHSSSMISSMLEQIIASGLHLPDSNIASLYSISLIVWFPRFILLW